MGGEHVETLMRLNVVSHSVGRTRILGAGKVLKNTLKGLAGLGVDVRFNEPVAEHRYNWIHDAPEGIIEAGFSGRPVLVGPNTAATPGDLPKIRYPLHPASIYLFPSEWPMKAWHASDFRECRCRVWATGIDLDDFDKQYMQRNGANRALIYFKHRSDELLSRVEELIRGQGWEYEILRYGSYDESKYRLALGRARCGIWVGGTESQGFALMEAMASGLPLLVLDASSLSDNVHDFRNPLVPRFPQQFIATGATTAPYFDSRCGWRIDANDLNGALLERFLRQIDCFDPATYVGEQFSLDQCARRLVEIAEELPVVQARSTPLGPRFSKTLRYLDLATRSWPWKWAGQRLWKEIR